MAETWREEARVLVVVRAHEEKIMNLVMDTAQID
jgi:hypothetical protein